jgi:hypothetical protein
MDAADGRYGYRAWDRRPGDDVDPSVALNAAEVVYEVANTAPPPVPAGVYPRFVGAERVPPTIDDVLNVGLVPLTDPSGMQGTLRGVQNAW